MNSHFYNLAFLGMLVVRGWRFVKHYCEGKCLALDSEEPGYDSLGFFFFFLKSYQDMLGIVTSFYSYFFIYKIKILISFKIWERNK